MSAVLAFLSEEYCQPSLAPCALPPPAASDGLPVQAAQTASLTGGLLDVAPSTAALSSFLLLLAACGCAYALGGWSSGRRQRRPARRLRLLNASPFGSAPRRGRIV